MALPLLKSNLTASGSQPWLGHNDCYPIITQQQIDAARDLRPARPGTVLQVTDSTVLKFGADVQMTEANTLRLIAEKAPCIPVPVVLHAYEKDGKGYIIMSKLEGEPLSHHWTSMSQDERRSIVEQLANHVCEWRKIRGPFIGAIDGGPCLDSIFNHQHGFAANQNATYGPYRSRQEFCEGVVQAFRNSRPAMHRDPLDEETEAQIINDVVEDLRDAKDDMVLTHGDLHMGNILVSNGRVTGIVDWGEASYSIEEREYLEATLRHGATSWKEAVGSIVPSFPRRFEHWNHVIKEMRAYSGI